jgi:signal transduction histidine kinase
MTARPTYEALVDEFIYRATLRLEKPLGRLLKTTADQLGAAEGAASDAAQQALQAIQHDGQDLLGQLYDIRDYAEAKTGRMAFDREPVELKALLEETLQIGHWLVKDKPQVKLAADLPAALPTLTLTRVRIQQVLLNFLHNASKFTAQGEIRLSVMQEPGRLVFCVADTGCGIPKKRFASVLAPFQSALADPEDARRGLGLGLPICRYVVERHGGELWFESKAGKGSKFYFSLPLG